MTHDAAAQHCQAYEHIAQLTADMLAAARNAQWDHLVELETQCKNAFAVLAGMPDRITFTPELVQRKAALIRQVLADDAEIRKLVEPWVAELGQWLGDAHRGHRLRDAYLTGH